MEADAPQQECAAIKIKHSVAKNLQDFIKLDKEWKELKLKDASTDLDKIFATLDEDSKKLKEFGPRRNKDTSQILSKLEVDVPEEHEHAFNLLNTDQEHNKGANIKLITAKRMIKYLYENSFALEKGADGKGGSMMCVLVGNYQGRKRNRSDDSSKTKCHCKHRNKDGHAAFKCGEPFFRALIAAINGGKGSGGARNFARNVITGIRPVL